MSGLRIIGSGHHAPGRPYTNDDLARVMDTNDAWIRQRTGISQRHFAAAGQGPADLALPASQQALESAGLGPQDIDYVLFSTMTPDHIFPGSAVLLASRLGCRSIPALDLRTQCAAMLYAFQVADGLLQAGAARRILIVGAEAHAAAMPWRDWDILEGTSDRKPAPADWDRATRHRGWAIIFGDGAGALVVERAEEPGPGIVGVDLQSDGRYAPLLCIPAGFRDHPYVSEQALASEATLIHMDGREVFKHAVTKLPRSIEALCARTGTPAGDIDWFIAHQANQRINEAVCQRLGVSIDKMPSNIDRFGNTSGATIPILMDEMRRDGRLKAGQLVCLVALGAGFHWGSLLLRT
ncbi:MAG TPA: beta-ketoacyl-ACP synthase III [Polyangiaceae bacterium]|jgi:3-oxoacyl-[acyl-carrier-protein] synthase-3|nr:beta-ketoacyl-ACP synthase III [Polyangiaceae bacterium]